MRRSAVPPTTGTRTKRSPRPAARCTRVVERVERHRRGAVHPLGLGLGREREPADTGRGVEPELLHPRELAVPPTTGGADRVEVPDELVAESQDPFGSRHRVLHDLGPAQIGEVEHRVERRVAEDLRDLERRAGKFVLDAEPQRISLVRPARVCHRDASRQRPAARQSNSQTASVATVV